MRQREKATIPFSIKDSDLSEKLDEVRQKSATLWQKGLVNHPDFTLHGIAHSEFIIETMDHLISSLDSILESKGLQKNKLSDFERFILGASAYLHDIGMLVDLDCFLEEQEYESSKVYMRLYDRAAIEEKRKQIIIEYCRRQQAYDEEKYVCELLDSETTIQPKELRNAEVIRGIHQVLSEYLITRFCTRLGISENNEYVPIGRVCRGHRQANLSHSSFRPQVMNGETIRIRGLAALLRIADELDYTPGRAPEIHFELYQRRLLRDPRSLRHWIKHYYTTGATIELDPGNQIDYPFPRIIVEAHYPTKEYELLFYDYLEKLEKQSTSDDVLQGLTELSIGKPVIERRIYCQSTKPLPNDIKREKGRKPVEVFLGQLEQEMAMFQLLQLACPMMPAENDLARTFGVERLRAATTYDWISQAECIVSHEFKIRAMKKIEWLLNLFTCETPIKCTKPVTGECFSTAKHKATVTVEYRMHHRQRFYRTRIEPPLIKGEQIQYRITDTCKGLFSYSRRQLEAAVRNRKWDLDEPLQYICLATLVPTKALSFKIVFPPSYRISRTGIRVQHLGTRGRLVQEEKRVRGCYSSGYIDSRRWLAVELDEPQPYAEYYVVWQPPKRGLAIKRR